MRAYCSPASANSPIWKSRSAASMADGFCSAACSRQAQGAIITKSARQTPADLIVRTSERETARWRSLSTKRRGKTSRRHIVSSPCRFLRRPTKSINLSLRTPPRLFARPLLFARALLAPSAGLAVCFAPLPGDRRTPAGPIKPNDEYADWSATVFDADRGHRPRPASAPQRVSDPASAQHDHRGAPADAVVEIEHVRVVHANATIGHEAADRARLIGAMDGVFAAAQRHGSRAHGVARRAAWNHARQRRLVAPDFGRRRPGRAELLAVDPGRAAPLLAGPADSDGVAQRRAVAEDVIELPLAGFHHDRAARIGLGKADHLAGLRGLRHRRGKQERGGNRRQ